MSFAAAICIVVAADRAIGQSGGSIYSGIDAPPGATYSLIGSPTSETDDFHPSNFNFNPSEKPNQVTFNWFFYRVGGDVQRPFGAYVKSDGLGITGTSNWPFQGMGTTASYQWTEYGAPNTIRFTADYTMTVSAPHSGSFPAQLSQTLQINNPGSSPLNIALFNAAVMYPGSHSSGLFASGGINSITETDGTYDVTHSAVGATAYQVATGSTLANLLYGGPATDLNNTGLPVASYSIDAFEWIETVPADGSITVQSSLLVTQAVPEPSTLLLVGTAAGVAMGFCRRRATSKLSVLVSA